jgi:ribonuclease BN (tRNA processing enzyme)
MTPTPSEIGQMARRAGARALVLSHFRKHMDAPARHDAAARAAAEAFGGPVTLAEDLDEFEL